MNNTKRIVLFVLLFWLVIFISANLVFTTKEIRSAYELPNVEVQLYEPVFGIRDLDKDCNHLEWKKLIVVMLICAGMETYGYSVKTVKFMSL